MIRSFRNASRSCRAVLTCKALLLCAAAFPPCLSMRNNAPMEHCAAEAFSTWPGDIDSDSASEGLSFFQEEQW